jgi:putative thioredoxin
VKSEWVIDSDEQAFKQDVIAASHEQPVLVDFWAPWCGPCRMLGPVLEKLAAEGAGSWRLVKVNVDHNPSISQAFGVQGIPAVKAFRDGRVVDEFVGAQPEPTVRRFLEGLLPGKADGLVEEASKAEVAHDLPSAEAAYRAALAEDDGHAAARLGLGRVLLGADRSEEALSELGRVPLAAPERAEAERLSAEARFRDRAGVSVDESEARRRVTADPDDLEARLALAAALIERQAHRDALEGLLEVLSRARGNGAANEAREQAHKDMLALFDLLGDAHDLTREYRPRLATALW